MNFMVQITSNSMSYSICTYTVTVMENDWTYARQYLSDSISLVLGDHVSGPSHTNVDRVHLHFRVSVQSRTFSVVSVSSAFRIRWLVSLISEGSGGRPLASSMTSNLFLALIRSAETFRSSSVISYKRISDYFGFQFIVNHLEQDVNYRQG